MDQYKKLNLIFGWIVFAIATLTYFLTVEPTASWWDCGEYISTAYKLQVGHPPGAPFFQLIGRIFSMFAFGDVTKVALMINIMSALSSSFTILFLFWTITHLAKKLVIAQGDVTDAKMYAVLGSGVVGALAYTFSDSFWFSAVEGEVYAMSSLFTAVVFWAILKWEQDAEKDHANRWIILIAYLVGLSIGVHLLNLLAIPAIALVWYFKKYKNPDIKGISITLIISVAMLGLIMNGIVPWVVKLSGMFELAFVNGIGLPFNSGTAFYFIVLIGLVVWGLWYTRLKRKVLLNTIVLSFAFILIGYSSFFMIIIRSNANTPINENSPKEAISLLSYLAREQYGDWPILKGQYYNAPIAIDEYGNRVLEDNNPIYIKDKKKGKYVVTDDRKNTIPVYDSRFTTLFPRMWSSQKPEHIRMYKEYGDVKGVPITITNDAGEKETLIKPTFFENLRFFFSYQINHMYVRYFMWNFAGRQNDIESQGGYEHGNWISGISFIDKNILGLGPQSNLPASKQNPAHNKFYMLPLILGIIGLFFHLKASNKDTLVVFILFIMTGLAIVVYLNQYPYQPRERDYAYAGSFYAFAIWIGLGVLGLYQTISKKIAGKGVAIGITGVCILLVPVIMANDGWDDHDRSGKYATLDFASNYLNSCEPNAILITNGDNDTFPLWYAQEVEGIRTDVRVVNFMLASGHWYVHQMMNKVYESEPLPFTLTYDQYEHGINTYTYMINNPSIKGYTELKDVIGFIASENKKTKVSTLMPSMPDGDKMNFSPTKKVKLIIDSAKVVNNGIVPDYFADRIVPEIEWEIKQNYLYKNDLMLLDIIASNNWERPIYFANPSSVSKVLAVEEYCHLEGFVYKFMPVKSQNYIRGLGGVNSEASYDILMNKCKWGNLNDPKVTIDRESSRNVVMPKQNFMRVADGLLKQDKKEEAIALLDRFIEVFPNEQFVFDEYILSVANLYYNADAPEKANVVLETIFKNYVEDIEYYQSLRGNVAAYYHEDYQNAMEIIQRMSMIAMINKQNELSTKMDSVYNQLQPIQ
jgi:hypothetical protein